MCRVRSDSKTNRVAFCRVAELVQYADDFNPLHSRLAAGRGTRCLSGDNMTEAKRAMPPRRRRGVWLLVTVPLVLLVASMLILLGLRRQAEVGRLPIPLESTQSASRVSTMSTPSAPPKDSKAKTAKAKAEAARAAAALKACRAKVQSADQAMAAGKNGMRHWAEHVQAQTDAFAGKITVGKMEDIFDRTMKAGDEDEERYTEAVKSYHDQDGSCRAVTGASAQVVKHLSPVRRPGKRPAVRACRRRGRHGGLDEAPR